MLFRHKFGKKSWLSQWHILSIVLSMICFEFACRKSNSEWDVNWRLPLIKTSLGMSDFIREGQLEKDSSGLLTLVHRESIYNISVDSLFTIPDTIRSRTFAIDSLSLFDARTVFPITLGAICRQAGFIGTLIIAQNGTRVPIPSIPSFNTPVTDISADTLFTSMTLEKGNMEIGFRNNLPIDIVDVKFELRNASDKALLVSGTFPRIAPGTYEKQIFPLDGKIVEGKLQAQLVSFSSPGSNGVPVLIDTSNSITTEIRVFNLQPITATAVWPAQNLVNQQQDFNIRGLGVFLKEALVKSGVIRFKMRSTIQDSVRFQYTLPAASKDGKTFAIERVLPPAPPGGYSEYNQDYDFSGYLLDMSGQNKDTFNAAFNTYLVRIDSTGIQKTFSKSDHFILELGFVGIKPSYARGYLATDTLKLDNQVLDLGLFEEFNGDLKFDDLRMEIKAENNIGANALLRLSNVFSNNRITGKSIQLTGAPLQNDHRIDRASDQQGKPPVTPAVFNYSISKANSNLPEFVSILPDQIGYSLNIITNPDGNISNFNDFIYDGKLLNMDMELSVPLNLSIADFKLVKVLDLDLTGEDYEDIQSGSLYFHFQNGFPFDCSLKMILLDDLGADRELLLDGKVPIKSALIGPSGRVEEPALTKLELDLDVDLLEQLKRPRKIRVEAVFNTVPKDVPVKIFHDYGIGLTVTGQFNYLVR